MKALSMKEALLGVHEAVGRKSASAFISAGPDGDKKNIGALHTGSPNAVRVPGGFILTMGLTRERVEQLRDACNELLWEPAKPLSGTCWNPDKAGRD